MAIKIAVVGAYNTGKSFARRTLDHQETFLITPSAKLMYLRDDKGKPIQRLNISTKNSKDTQSVIDTIKQATNLNLQTTVDLMRYMIANEGAMKNKSDLKIEGNYVLVTDLADITVTLRFLKMFRPEIKIINIPDFTHFIANRIADQNFIQRKNGGDAYQRFWELAADGLNHFIKAADNLPDDVFIITEYHSEYDENSGEYKVFTAAGKMMEEKFKPESYYDFLFFSHIEPDSEGNVNGNSYRFITRRYKQYPARSAELFSETMIPNDMKYIIDTIRESYQITK